MICDFACALASLMDDFTWVSMTFVILLSRSTLRTALRMNATKPAASVIPTSIFICRVDLRRLRRLPFRLDGLPEWNDLPGRDDLKLADEELP